MTCSILMRDFQSRAPLLCTTAQLFSFMDGWDGVGAFLGGGGGYSQPPSLYFSLASVKNNHEGQYFAVLLPPMLLQIILKGSCRLIIALVLTFGWTDLGPPCRRDDFRFYPMEQTAC